MLRLALTFILVILLTISTAFADITGKPRVVDGDTIIIRKTRIRLHGIDAPEYKQKCNFGDRVYSCGKVAKDILIQSIGTKRVTCKGDKKDRYGRLIAVCFAGPHDLNAKMVRQGWALAYRRYSTDYVDDENDAKVARKGLWRGSFEPPWEWRRNR